jgi:hypothetical protein
MVMAREVVYTADVKIRGITALLMHRCGVIEQKKAKSKNVDYSGEWVKACYVSGDGNLMCPAINIESMLRGASKGIKVGRVSLTREMPPNINVSPFEVPLLVNRKRTTVADVESNSWLFSIAAVVNKSRVMRTRAMIPIGWEMEFSVDVMSNLIKEETLSDIIENGGTSEGLMDWRPGSPKSGKFGQFELVSFKTK